MYKIFTASKDTYITNKILAANLSASHANVGQASTLDLFKLYDEASGFTGFTGSYSAPTEYSKLLIKFNTDAISRCISTGAELDSFRCYLYLKDIQGDLIAPKDFNVVAYPLSKSFDEGYGKDIYSFNELDHSNWMTASYTNAAYVLWTDQGAGRSGLLRDNDLDIISSGTIAGSDLIDFTTSQYFENGNEDLYLDVTTAMSATMAGYIPDCGFLISFSGSDETDQKSRFVKRFGSRHARSNFIQPSMILSYDDSLIDSRAHITFNNTGSLFLSNKVYDIHSNLVSGSYADPLVGTDSLHVIFHTGSWATTSSAGQYDPAGKFKTGIYSASVVFNEFDTSVIANSVTFAQHAAASSSLKIYERWMDSAEKITYYTGSFYVRNSSRNISAKRRDLKFSLLDQKSIYKIDEYHQIRLFVRDDNYNPRPVRIPISLPTLKFRNSYYRIRDVNTGKIVVPFTKGQNATKISVDNEGMYFTFSTQALAIDRLYTFDILLVTNSNENIYETKSVFKVGT